MIARFTSSIELNLYICNTKVKNDQVYKYLGVYIDDRLKWDLHIDYVYKKLIKLVGIFFKLRNVLPNHCLKKLSCICSSPYILQHRSFCQCKAKYSG